MTTATVATPALVELLSRLPDEHEVLIGHGDVAWNGQLAPKIEQIVLDVGEKRGQRLRQLGALLITTHHTS